MKRIVRMLEDMKHEAERNFIKNSLIKRKSVINIEPLDVPDVDADLEKIAQLDEAINVLNNHLMQKPLKPKRDVYKTS